MSELQIALLVIGFGVVVAVYGYGWWQQRLYRRKFGEAFRSTRPDASDQRDALYRTEVAHRDASHQEATEQAQQLPESVIDDVLEDTSVAESLSDSQNEPCALLDGRCDFIIELHLNEPSPAAVLEGLWQRKFDFGKPVQVCGLVLGTKKWERAIADGTGLYAHIRIALQLVDRGGAISAAKLADFRDLILGIAQHIKADATVPDIDETHRLATELDAFCASVDQMVGVNLVLPGERPLFGGKISQAAALMGMTLELDGAFHLLDARRQSLFSLSNRDNRPFQHHALGTFSTKGVTLLMDVPRVENPATQFDAMLRVARTLSNELQANVVDDNLVALSVDGLARIRDKITGVETTMRERGIAPGSAQARRLFA